MNSRSGDFIGSSLTDTYSGLAVELLSWSQPVPSTPRGRAPLRETFVLERIPIRNLQSPRRWTQSTSIDLDSRIEASSPTIAATRLAEWSYDQTSHGHKPGSAHDPREVVLVYPSKGAGGVTIFREDLDRLNPGRFLNDSLIELGLRLWLESLRVKDTRLTDEIHVFSSFFFNKLKDKEGIDYNSVKSWSSKFDLFSKKFVFIPINEDYHWYLAIICFPEHTLEAPSPQQPVNDRGPSKTWILILDSLGGSHNKTVRMLRQYLQSEAQERHNVTVELEDAQSSGGFVDDRHLIVPIQPNDYDCGIYLLHFAEVFYTSHSDILHHSPTAKCEGADQYAKWWKVNELNNKREQFRAIAQGLSADWLKTAPLVSEYDNVSL